MHHDIRLGGRVRVHAAAISQFWYTDQKHDRRGPICEDLWWLNTVVFKALV